MSPDPSHGERFDLRLIPPLGNQIEGSVDSIEGLQTAAGGEVCMIDIASVAVEGTETWIFDTLAKFFARVLFCRGQFRRSPDVEVELGIGRGNPVELPSHTFAVGLNVLEGGSRNCLECDIAVRKVEAKSAEI